MRITDVPCRCCKCGWQGKVIDCEPDINDEADLGCPKCGAVIWAGRFQDTMKLCVITLTFNEAVMLPFFLRHYERTADSIVIYDGGSTDGTREIAAAHPLVTLRDHLTGGKVDDLANALLKSTAYTHEDADWFIVVDCDELVHHPALRDYLAESGRRGVNIIQCEGWQMIGDAVPADGLLTDSIRFGVRDAYTILYYDKSAVFQSGVDIHFDPGAHTFRAPNANMDVSHSVKLLHYKWLSADFVWNKAHTVRLSQSNIDNHLGFMDGKPSMEGWEAYYAKARAARVKVL